MSTCYFLRNPVMPFLFINTRTPKATVLYYFKIVHVLPGKRVVCEELYEENKYALWTTVLFIIFEGAELLCRSLIIAKNSINLCITVILAQENARAYIVGKIIGHSNARITLFTHQEHRVKNSTSTVKIDGIATDQARITHHGMIKIIKTAKKSIASQHSRHIALTTDARILVSPALEVAQNDVQCTHGSATGMLDDESVLFLQMRGIDQKNAHRLLLNPFISFSAHTALNTQAHQLLSQVLERVRYE